MNELISPYNSIAKEYYNDTHITSRNFDESSKIGLAEFIDKIPKKGFVLDIGAGRGRTNEFLSVDTTRIFQLDSSIEMLNLTPREDSLIRIHADATDLPFIGETFNLVTSFLCDPFLGLNFLSEAYRVLHEEGVLIFTTPSYNWGKPLRHNIGLEINETRFVTKENNLIKVPSILIKNSQIIEMMKHVGFKGNNILNRNLKLPESIKIISNDIVSSAKSLNKSPYEIELINLFYVKK